jgi:CRP/FNR family transcriptional regulator, dissimilatory nitrate respiration regulator
MSTDAPVQAEYAAGESLFEQGKAAHHLFIINSGHVQIRRRVFEEEIVLETLGKGSICGDVAFAAGASYPVSAVALDDVQAVVVHRDNLQTVMLDNAKVVARMASRLAARLTAAHFRVAALSMPDPLARVMLQLRHEMGQALEALGADADGPVFAPLPYDLPEVLALEKSTVDACLRGLIRDALVESDGAGRFRIADARAFDRRLRYLELASRIDA